MNTRYTRSRQVLVLPLLLSIIISVMMPGNTITAQAEEASRALTGFVKVSPANNATNQPTSLTLRWNPAPANPYGHGRYYKYCYYTSGGICDFVGGLYTTQLNISGLARGTTYFWQIQVVYCKDAQCGQKEKHEANDGQIWSFRTGGSEPPAAFSKLSPTNGATNVSSKILSWAASQGAASYQYCFSPNVNDQNCSYLNGWRNAGNVTSITIPNDLKFVWGNTYYWQVRASNGGGTRVANDGAWWAFTTANLVGKATLLSPSGTPTDTSPTFRWNHVSGVTWYFLWLRSTRGDVFAKWYEAMPICSGATCEVTPPLTLWPDHYTWWVQTYNPTGYGPWSNGLAFNIAAPTPPPAATLVSPTGSTSDTTPSYVWNSVSGSTWYYLWVSRVNTGGSLTTIHTQWYQAPVVCSGGTCSVTPSGVTLASGNYRWWIQTWSNGGYGPWSSAMNFSLP
ncbi:MAG TPA: hypothetical protein VFO91_09740 [Anaerolineales bacterium]|nr:hypothetical protein [Anaerolineales bacterium]